MIGDALMTFQRSHVFNESRGNDDRKQQKHFHLDRWLLLLLLLFLLLLLIFINELLAVVENVKLPHDL